MLWLRRTIALFLAFICILLFIPTLVIFRVNATIGNPDFYIDQLRRADVYNFLYTDVLPYALERAAIGGTTTGGGTNLAWAKPHLIAIAKQALPPPWLQAQTEQVIKAVLPYILGDTPGFSVNVPLKGRAQATASAIKDTLHQEGVLTRLYDQTVDLFMPGVIKGVPLPLSSSEMKNTVRTVFPPDWLLKQTDYAIDECVPYFTKDKEHFLLQINLLERLDSLKAVVTDILKKPEIYDYICQEIVVKSVTQNIQRTIPLPAGMTITESEILSVVKEALPLSWYQAQVPDIVEPVFSYLGGTSQNLVVVVPLTDRKPAITEALGKFLDQKLERELGAFYTQFKKLLGIDMSRAVASVVNTALPNQLTFNETQLGQALGGTGGENPLVKAREWLQKGLTYSDQDLRTSLGANQSRLEDVRQWLSTGLTFTESDLRRGITAGEDFDNTRSTLGTVRRLIPAAWLILALLLVAIGLLGGRRWSRRLLWAAAVLGAAAIVAFIIFGPLFSALAQPQLTNALRQVANQPDAFQALVAGKGVAIAQNAINSFIGGIRTQAIILLVLALVLTGGGVFWQRRERKTANEKPIAKESP